MGSGTENALADGASADVRANIENMKTNVVVQRVTRTFLEFVAPCEPADTHDAILQGGRSRANSDDSILYGEYGYTGHATPCRSTLASANSFAEGDVDDTLSANVEKCWPAEHELAQARVLKEIAGIPWCGLSTHTFVSYRNVSNEVCNDTAPLQDIYGLPISFQVGQQGSKELQAQAAQSMVQAHREQAREANEIAAYLEMQAAQLREQIRNAEQGIKFTATELDCNAKLDCIIRSDPWSVGGKLGCNESLECKGSWICEENKNCNDRNSMTKASTSLPPISEGAVDVCPLPETGDVIVARQTSNHHRHGHFRAAASKSSTSKTTLMLRNIPNSYTRDALLGHFEEFGLQDCVDFIYVPMDFHRAAGLGYAFVNLTSNKDAFRAKEMFDGFCSWGTTSQKVCEVSFSYPLQGLDSHIEQFRNSCVMHESVPDSFKPGLFEGGIRQPFPMPTKQVPLPRMMRPIKGFDGSIHKLRALEAM